MNAPVTIEELDAVLGAASINPQSINLPPLDADIDLDEILEIAAETDERGPLETIKGLLEGLRVRHACDDVTLATLAAIKRLHLPMALDAAKG